MFTPTPVWQGATVAEALVLLFYLLAPPTESGKEHDCTLPKPRDVHFSSVNMKNVLHWLPPEGLGDGALYTVKYKMYGTKDYHYKLECKDISKIWCDLSNETYDYEEHYYAKVRATLNHTACSKWAETDRFFPKTDTQLDPPIVNVHSDERSISINLTGPVKWKANSKDIVSFHEIYSLLEYEVTVFNNKTQQWWHFRIQTNSWDINKLSPSTTYCVMVRTLIPVPYKSSKPSELVCTSTLEDHTAWLMTEAMFQYSLPVTIVVLLILAMGCAIYKYIYVSQPKFPTNLVLHCSDGYNKNVFLSHEQVVINFISVSVEDSPLNIHKNTCCNLQDPLQNFHVSPDESSIQKRALGEVSEVKHLGYTAQVQEESTCDMQQDLELPLRTPQGHRHTSVLNATESVEYGLVKTGMDIPPAQEQREHYLKENICAAKNPPLYSSQNAFLNPSIAKRKEAQYLWLSTVDKSPCLLLNNMQHEQTEDEESSTVVVDWDPQTKRLTIPSLFHCVSDKEGNEAGCIQSDLHEEEGLLSKLYERQIPEEQSEDSNDIYLKQLKEQWGLHVQMEE